MIHPKKYNLPKKYNVMVKVSGGRKYCVASADKYKEVETILDNLYKAMNNLKFIPVAMHPKIHFQNVLDIESLTLEDEYERLIEVPEEDD